MDRAAVEERIPHRPPFLFIDEVVDLGPRRIVTRKRANPQAEFFRGHYPGNPVMPGVLLCECCFQAGALLVAQQLAGQVTSNGTPVITRIKEAKFKHIVRPNDLMDIEVTLDEELNDVFFMTGRLTVEGKTALRVTFAATLLATE